MSGMCTRSSISRALARRSSLADAAHPQAEGDVVQARQMREQRVALEHHRGAALRRRQVGDVAAAIRMSPSLASSWPAIMRKVEVLPQPDGPIRQQ